MSYQTPIFEVGERVFILDSGSNVHLGTVTEKAEFGYYVKRDGLENPELQTKFHIFHYPKDVLQVESQLYDEITMAEMALKEFRNTYWELIDDRINIKASNHA